MLYRIHFKDAGLSKTGLTPVWKSLLTAVENGTDKSGSAPVISEIGGGILILAGIFVAFRKGETLPGQR